MKRQKIAADQKNQWTSNDINISLLDDKHYFEIGESVTTDIAEAVAIMMRLGIINKEAWNTPINKDDLYNTKPENALYWMTGGDEEWMIENNYTKNWHECYLLFQEEFGLTIIEILEKSETLNDVRKGFIKHLNLDILYEFALRHRIA